MNIFLSQQFATLAQINKRRLDIVLDSSLCSEWRKCLSLLAFSLCSMSLYTKYRSQTFDDLIEQDTTKDILKQQVMTWAVNHNYLFFGSRGIGKTSVARILAKAVNCLDQQWGNPCNKCSNCVAINAGQTMDIIEIDAASHTGVDNVREEIIGKAAYPPSMLRKKVYIIDEVHMLSKGAFNALLKIMEEPPAHLMFILATTEAHKVPDTIISRCQVFNFRKITRAGMVWHLQNICKLEGLTCELEALELIARLAEGGMRDAVKYLEQVSVLWAITASNVTSFLGISPLQTIQEFVKAGVSGDTATMMTMIDQCVDQSIDISNFVKDSLWYLDSEFQQYMSQPQLVTFVDMCKDYLSGARVISYHALVLKQAIMKSYVWEKNN